MEERGVRFVYDERERRLHGAAYRDVPKKKKEGRTALCRVGVSAAGCPRLLQSGARWKKRKGDARYCDRFGDGRHGGITAAFLLFDRHREKEKTSFFSPRPGGKDWLSCWAMTLFPVSGCSKERKKGRGGRSGPRSCSGTGERPLRPSYISLRQAPR